VDKKASTDGGAVKKRCRFSAANPGWEAYVPSMETPDRQGLVANRYLAEFPKPHGVMFTGDLEAPTVALALQIERHVPALSDFQLHMSAISMMHSD
jgi:hypothetical protein